MDMSNARRHFSIYVADGYSMLAFSAVVGAINAINRTLGCGVYTWDVVSHEQGPITSDTLAQVITQQCVPGEIGAYRSSPSRINVLLSGQELPPHRQKLVAWVREGLARGVKVISVGDATMLLAEEGMLAGKRCAVHWKDFGVAVERFPAVHFTRAFFNVDGHFYTCAGEMAVFDLMLRFIELDFGKEAAEEAGVRSLHGSPRGASDRQKLPSHIKLERTRSPLLTIVDLMEENVSDPVDMRQLIDKVSLSRRQVERLFERDMGMSPKRFYLKIRLDRARELLIHSSMPVVDIAVATGFISASHFAKTFKSFFGISPTGSRKYDLPRSASMAGPSHRSTNDNEAARVLSARLGSRPLAHVKLQAPTRL